MSKTWMFRKSPSQWPSCVSTKNGESGGLGSPRAWRARRTSRTRSASCVLEGLGFDGASVMVHHEARSASRSMDHHVQSGQVDRPVGRSSAGFSKQTDRYCGVPDWAFFTKKKETVLGSSPNTPGLERESQRQADRAGTKHPEEKKTAKKLRARSSEPAKGREPEPRHFSQVGRRNVTPQRVCFGWKGVRPGVRLESRSGEPVRSPKNTSENVSIALQGLPERNLHQFIL